MLHRLYNPFLWRSLKVANIYVRANAATLFLDAFPLQDPDWSREEIDDVMQKQFDAMTVRVDVAFCRERERGGGVGYEACVR